MILGKEGEGERKHTTALVADHISGDGLTWIDLVKCKIKKNKN
jgi:hypothetical protein